MKEAPRIAVLGAGGHTGRFVVRSLHEMGLTPISVGRTELTSAIDRAVDFSDETSLDRALDGADAVLNCAGPFFDTAEPAAWAALRAGIPYLDITAEQWTADRLFKTLDARARERGVTIVPAMAFYGGLTDLMVTMLAEGADVVDNVEIATALDRWHPTRGTRLTGARNTYARLVIRGGALTPVPNPAPQKDWLFPDPFGKQAVTCAPMSEMVLLSRHMQIGSATTYLNLRSLRDLADQTTPPPAPADSQGRSAQRFAVDVQIAIAGRNRRAIATGRDIYAATAPILIAGCLELLAGRAAKPGVHAPGELFDASALLARLAPEITIQITDEDVAA